MIDDCHIENRNADAIISTLKRKGMHLQAEAFKIALSELTKQKRLAKQSANDITALRSRLEQEEKERDELRIGIKRLSDEEELCGETMPDDAAFDLVRLAAKLAASEQSCRSIEAESNQLRDVATRYRHRAEAAEKALGDARNATEQAKKEREELRGKHEYQYLRACREEKRAIDAEKALADATMSPDVINLVIAARAACDSWALAEDEGKALDKALEPFSERVPYENEPDDETTP